MRRPAPAEAAELRHYLTEIDYTEDRVLEVLGSLEVPTGRDPARPDLLRRTATPGAWNAIARLFFLGIPIAEDHWSSLPSGIRERLEDLELVTVDGPARPACVLHPFRDLWIAADRYPGDDETPREDHVLTAGPVARHLSYFTATEFLRGMPRRPRILDLCAGGGVHAIRLAGLGGEVVGTDLNPRAIEFARFNAAMNGQDDVEFRVGDGLAPVEGESFDLIVCNPPFVLTPTADLVSCNNPGDLDRFCEGLVRSVPAILRRGGRFQMIFEWAEIEGEGWQDRLPLWVDGSGCDAWFFHANQESPESYAGHRIPEQAALREFGDRDVATAAWARYYDEHHVRAIHGGFVLLRKRTGLNWIRFREIAGTLTPGAAAEVERSLSHFDRLDAQGNAAGRVHDEASDLHGPGDAGWLSVRLRLRDGIEREEKSESAAGRWQRSITRLHCGAGMPQSVHVQPTMADLLGCFDGERTVSHAIGQFATSAGLDRDQVETECLRIVRHFLETGWLEFSEPAPTAGRE